VTVKPKIAADAESDTVGLDAMILDSLLSPAFLGYRALDCSAVMAIAGMWYRIIKAAGDAVLMPATEEEEETESTSEVAPRPFQLATPIVKACLLNADDVKLTSLVELCIFIPGVLTHMGSWMGPFNREGHKNATMLKSRVDEAVPEASLRALLQSEVSAGIHSPDGILADPSGAVAVLWAYRGFIMWATMLRRCVTLSSWEGEPPEHLMKASFEYAYETEIKQFHGPMMRSAVSIGTNLIPRWEDVWGNYGPTLEDVQHDIGQWLEAMEELLPRIDAMIREFDLYDRRKTF